MLNLFYACVYTLRKSAENFERGLKLPQLSADFAIDWLLGTEFICRVSHLNI